jgi:hypothetical protein
MKGEKTMPLILIGATGLAAIDFVQSTVDLVNLFVK